MVMFPFTIAFTLGLLALASGIALISMSSNIYSNVSLARIFGTLIAVLAGLSIICTSYTAMRFWNEGMIMPRPGRFNAPGFDGANGNGKVPPVNRPIPANEQEMKRQNRPGPPENIRRMRGQDQRSEERHQFQEQQKTQEIQGSKSSTPQD